MLVLLENILQNCRKNETSVTEKGLSVSVRPERSERVIFFRTDCRDARETLCITHEDLKSCDYLILYIKTNNQSPLETICFLELKGNKFDHAVKQICNTHSHLKDLSKPMLDNKQYKDLIQSACICMRGSATTESERKGRAQLKEIFGENVHIKHGIRGKFDIGHFLRGLPA